MFSQQLDEAFGCVVGQRHHLSFGSCFPQGPSARCHAASRAEKQHGLCVADFHFLRQCREVGFVTGKFFQPQWFLAHFVKPGIGSHGGIGAKRVVGLEHRNAADAQTCQVFYGACSLTLVRCAHIEHPGVHGLMQHHGPGAGGHQGHFAFGQQRQQGFGMGCAPVEEQGNHSLFVQQFSGRSDRLFGVKLVVHRQQLQFLPVDATFGIHGVQIQPRAIGVFFHARRHRPGEARGLTNPDLRPSRLITEQPQRQCGTCQGRAQARVETRSCHAMFPTM